MSESGQARPVGRMESEFRAKREAGRKLLVPYITGGLRGWQDAIRAAAATCPRADAPSAPVEERLRGGVAGAVAGFRVERCSLAIA